MGIRRACPSSSMFRVALIATLVFFAGVPAADARLERDAFDEGPVPELGTVLFYGYYHNANKLLLHVSNTGDFGDSAEDPRAPSGEWPAGSGVEYLYAAGLWVAGVI